MEKNFRKIKVQGRLQRFKWSEKWVPELLLKGDWLLQAGFEPGHKTTIKVEKGRLTILNL